MRPGFAMLALCACGGTAASPVGELRFRNRPPVWVVNDRRDLPAPPDTPVFVKEFHHFDGRWYKRIDRWMKMQPAGRAANVNSLDEVPDSTWFTNRIGRRDLSPAEIAVGPNLTGSPEGHRPLVISSSKVGGTAVGFIVSDQRGIKYLLKFDERGIPDLETGADLVAQRLLWAAGYNVPEDYILEIRRQDLTLARDAVVVDELGRKKPMTAAFVDRALAKVDVRPDGTIRALASQFLPGEPIGGHSREGTREDDPNDRVPHQRRRELRGAFAIFAWIDHTDVKQDNTVDAWVADPADPDVHYVVHYLVDFGKALGAQAFINCRNRSGLEPHDLTMMVKSLVTVGIWQRSRRRCPRLDLPGVALANGSYQPARWRPNTMSYFPLVDRDRFDGFWGAKIVARFNPAQIRAAVDQARFSDPRAAGRLTELLVRRQELTIRHWFARVNPIDRVEVAASGAGWSLCFDDLAIAHRLVGAGATRYRARAFDRDGRPTGWSETARAAADGHACFDPLPPAAGRDGYTIVELVTLRPGERLPATLVHLARTPETDAPRVIGIRRL